jgi:hypothetical protein
MIDLANSLELPDYVVLDASLVYRRAGHAPTTSLAPATP